MKCPQIHTGKLTFSGTWENTPIDCLREECGQWDESTELCSRVAEVRILTAIGDVLGRISDNLPPAVTPRQ